MRTRLSAIALFAVAALASGPASSQSAAIALPADPGLRAVACAGVLDGVAKSMRPGGATNAMADELSGFSARWRAQALKLAPGAGRSEADVEAAIADQSAKVFAGEGQGLAPKSFDAAQICQAEAEPLPPA
jgi:hypothetical protein